MTLSPKYSMLGLLSKLSSQKQFIFQIIRAFFLLSLPVVWACSQHGNTRISIPTGIMKKPYQTL